MFTNVENRQEEQLMAELHREPTKDFRKVQGYARLYGASHAKRLEILPNGRSYEEQRRVKEEWDRRHPRDYMLPGENEGGHF